MTRSILIASLMLAFAGSASAAIYTNVPGGATTGLQFDYFGNGANPSGDSPKVGELFSLSSAAQLSSFSFYAIGNTLASFQLNVAQWNPNNTPGANLLSSVFNSTDIYNAAGGYTTIKFDNLGLDLTAGTKYIAYLTSTDSSLTHLSLSRTQTAQDASGFGKGMAYLSTTPGQGWQVPFNGFLGLQYTAVTSTVPEPESYAMLLAGLGLMGVMSRRRNASHA